jgi:predicted DNA-binding protein
MSALAGVMRSLPVTCKQQIADRTRTEEVAMSAMDTGSNRGSVKTLAIRLEPELHQQLSIIAQLRDSTITDEIRQAIEAHIVLIKATPELAARADNVLEGIEREAIARREAIATLFGGDTANPATPISGGARGRKTTAPRGQEGPAAS